MEASNEGFTAAVRVGKGIRPLTQSGSLVVETGWLRLRDGKERVIAEGPVEEIWAHKGWLPGSGFRLHIGGTKYTLDQAGGFTAPGMMVGTHRLTEAFLEWFPAHGGNVGKPPG